jgi:hypothetical protein
VMMSFHWASAAKSHSTVVSTEKVNHGTIGSYAMIVFRELTRSEPSWTRG